MFEDGVVPGRVGGDKALGMVPSLREMQRSHLANAARNKPSISLSRVLEINNNLEIENELACPAAIFWAPEV